MGDQKLHVISLALVDIDPKRFHRFAKWAKTDSAVCSHYAALFYSDGGCVIDGGGSRDSGGGERD